MCAGSCRAGGLRHYCALHWDLLDFFRHNQTHFCGTSTSQKPATIRCQAKSKRTPKTAAPLAPMKKAQFMKLRAFRNSLQKPNSPTCTLKRGRQCTPWSHRGSLILICSIPRKPMCGVFSALFMPRQNPGRLWKL